MRLKKHSRSALIVGGGIAGCMCALSAVHAGYKVTLIAKGPDPRFHSNADPYSSTFGGEDSRYVTLTEGHPYLGTATYINQMYPDMQSAFMKSIHDGGWLSQDPDRYSPTTQKWLQRRLRENENTTAIAKLLDQYIAENRLSMSLWEELFLKYPHLCDGISLNNSGILRLYGHVSLFEMAKNFHREQKVLLESLTPCELVKRFAIHTEAVTSGFIKGGLVVEGLTFRVQRLVKNILCELEKYGATLKFDCQVAHIKRNQQDEVTGLVLSNNATLMADNYSLHLGAYDSSGLLDQIGFTSEIAGVAGGWIIVPKPPGHILPIKVHDGQHRINGVTTPVVDLNINPARLDDGSEVLIIGGGYLFCGMAPFELPDKAKRMMMSEIHRVTELVLGSTYRTAFTKKTVYTSSRTCVRSFTPNDKELNAVIPTCTGGVLTIGGGGNTGTTAKAAWVANQFIKLVDSRHSSCSAYTSRA